MVSDRGPGVPPQVVPRLFEHFWRLGAHRASGTGLGLFIARGILDAHGGKLWAENREGGGSTFAFALPRIAKAMQAA